MLNFVLGLKNRHYQVSDMSTCNVYMHEMYTQTIIYIEVDKLLKTIIDFYILKVIDYSCFCYFFTFSNRLLCKIKQHLSKVLWLL